jgi:hypothetical protein
MSKNPACDTDGTTALPNAQRQHLVKGKVILVVLASIEEMIPHKPTDLVLQCMTYSTTPVDVA